MKVVSCVLPIGPYHPALKEGELFKLIVDGEEVVDAEIKVGYNHRGIEKLAESMTYDQVVYLVERICGICSNIHPLCFVQVIEDIAGIEVPDRARYIRTIIAELERVHSHLLWLGVLGHIVGFDTLLMWSWKIREPILDIFEEITGNRRHYAINVIGGVKWDISPEAAPKILSVVRDARKSLNRLLDIATRDSTTLARLRNVGVLSKHDAKKFCVVGPTARGSGLHIDTRKDHPYAAYKEISFDVPTVNDGDVWARTYVRILEMIESLSIVEQALGALPSGPIKADRKEIPPWQEGTRVCEAPRGEDLHFVITGENNRPWRLKVRSPSVVNVPSLTKMLPGYTVADSVAIIGSIDPCFSCTDRVAIVKEDGGVKEFYSFDELIKMCRRKYGGV
ncbi:MAG: NADH dehydrogenase subunit [Candidatus Methanomethylicota archaeon]|uniref:NADH dehydrogenase subunit n=1 Tax=Thermoproteota archaeon TaxID=2056631 RepID=A0A497EZT3_9CREN|nr:MAG: NADH dehydrogenase subunit [Candidatus Verstraetearchaeota archaeon]